ncbi:GDSL-type esterase/lipase family protein [Alicyclobacillus tolerans]|uniref:SGNH/GDSL hydrolase family protein n=1 Tax=Alicyclobacillus tolerans TaxID=90970 RepID=UPI001F181423|nr:GDSL-type esterase/lipase family protein [Alicyclobacillus tolerans]MCF8563817.1 GDSL-type esterase/lipase family protein [Alicyclobacillus tolerans]
MPRHVYLALGDSITAGIGSSHPSLSFVRHLSEFLQKKSIADRTISVAQHGWTAKDLFQVTSTLTSIPWDEVRFTTLSLGSSDLVRLLRPQRFSLSGDPFEPRSVAKKADEFGYHTDKLFRWVKEKEVPEVVTTTLYNPFPVFPIAQQFVEGMNMIIKDCSSYYGFTVVDVQKTFLNREPYLIHGYRTGNIQDLLYPRSKPVFPNNAGHLEMANLVIRQLEKQSKQAPKTKQVLKRKYPIKTVGGMKSSKRTSGR